MRNDDPQFFNFSRYSRNGNSLNLGNQSIYNLYSIKFERLFSILYFKKKKSQNYGNNKKKAFKTRLNFRSYTCIFIPWLDFS